MRITLVGSRHFGVATFNMLREHGVDIVRVVVADGEDRLAAAARNAGILGTGEVFTGKLVNGDIMPMNKKAWAAKFKKFARLAGVNEPKKNCHGVRKARAEVAAYSECTEAQMMAMFGWRDHKMPALYIAKANRDKLAISGMEKIVAFDQSQSLDDFLRLPEANSARTPDGNGVVIPG